MTYLNLDENRPLDIIFVGRVTIDFNPAYSDKVKEDFKPLKDVHYFEKFVGGSPANTAVGVSRLGLKTGFIGKVSDDQFGDFVTEYFNKNGIDTSHIVRSKGKERLGITFTEMLSSGESKVMMFRSHPADLKLSVDDIDEEYIRSAKSILISGTALAESPSREAAIKAATLARRNGTNVIFDIDYRPHNWKSEDEIAIYHSIIARESDIIMGSREEFDLTEHLVKTGMTDIESAAYWQSYNAKICVIKHGMEGSTAYADDGQQFSIKPFPVNARKSFGGGDGYAAAFLYGLYNGLDIIDCLELGSAEASMMVSANNCSEDLPGIEAVREFIRKEKEQYGEMIAKA